MRTRSFSIAKIGSVLSLAGILRVSRRSIRAIGRADWHDRRRYSRTLGQPDQGFEGNRFSGNTMYEGLTLWDLSSADKASVIIPGLATEMGCFSRRQNQMGIQAAARREIPRWLGFQCRRSRVERREGA